MVLNDILCLFVALQQDHRFGDFTTSVDFASILPSPPILAYNSQTVGRFVDCKMYVRFECRRRRSFSREDVECGESLRSSSEKAARSRGEEDAIEDRRENRLKWARGSWGESEEMRDVWK